MVGATRGICDTGQMRNIKACGLVRCCVIDRTMRVPVLTIGARPSQGWRRKQPRKSDISTSDSAMPLPLVDIKPITGRKRRIPIRHFNIPLEIINHTRCRWWTSNRYRAENAHDEVFASQNCTRRGLETAAHTKRGGASSRLDAYIYLLKVTS